MSKYPDVKENDTLTFSADRYNAVNRLLDNAEKLVPHHNEPVPYQREPILVYLHAGTLKAGDAAEITGIWDNPRGEDEIEEAYYRTPIVYAGKISPQTMKDAPICVVKDTLNEGEVGEAYINGPVFCRLNVEDKAHIYAEIDPEHSGCFVTSADRGYPVIWKADEKKEGEMCAVIMLQSPNGKEYDGPFAVSEVNKKLEVAEGFMLRNGVWGKMPVTRGIAPKDGWLCLCTDIDTATKTWKEAQYEICEPSEKAYPIAKIEVKGETIRIRQCYVTVAIFNLVKRCPLAEL